MRFNIAKNNKAHSEAMACGGAPVKIKRPLTDEASGLLLVSSFCIQVLPRRFLLLYWFDIRGWMGRTSKKLASCEAQHATSAQAGSSHHLIGASHGSTVWLLHRA